MQKIIKKLTHRDDRIHEPAPQNSISVGFDERNLVRGFNDILKPNAWDTINSWLIQVVRLIRCVTAFQFQFLHFTRNYAQPILLIQTRRFNINYAVFPLSLLSNVFHEGGFSFNSSSVVLL